MNKIKRNRAIALVLSISLVILIIVSLSFIVIEANHDCEGEHCPICQQIEICDSNIKIISLAYLFALIIFVVIHKGLIVPNLLSVNNFFHTPVSLKVRLLN